MFKLTSSVVDRMPREEAKGYVEAMGREDLADFMEASNAAGLATGTGGNLFYEAAAKEIRKGEIFRLLALRALDLVPAPRRRGLKKAFVAAGVLS